MALSPSNVERTLVLVLVALSAAFAPAHTNATGEGTTSGDRAGLELTFLGNQGFLLVSRGQKVLVDALVATTHRQYVWQGEALRGDLAAARPPFDDVDLVLASHFHGDHFDPVAVGQHLTASPRARFVSTPGAVERLRSEYGGFDSISSRIEAVYPRTGEVRRLAELGLEIYRLHHGRDRPEIQNVGFVVDIGGWKVGVVGDTEASAAEFAASGFPSELDVGLFPAWLFDPRQWPRVVGEAVQAQVWVPTHVASGENAASFAPDGQLAGWTADFGERFPRGLLFTRLLEKRSLSASTGSSNALERPYELIPGGVHE